MGVSYATLMLVLAASLLSPARVSISVVPTAGMANGTVRVTCSVPRHPDNRWLTIAAPPYTSSTRQLDGETAPITHTLYVDHLPCEVEEMQCIVEDALGRTFRAVQPIIVAGCSSNP